jgi:hypothetical protein
MFDNDCQKVRDMDAQKLRRILRTAATGTVLFGLTVPVTAGDICEKDERPTIPAACQPNWGFHQTCWKRMPPVPPCTTGFCDGSYLQSTMDPGMTGEVWTQGDGSTLYTPHSGVYVPGQTAGSSPISILPQSVNGRYAAPSSGIQGVPAPGMPSIMTPSLNPATAVPQVPEGIVPPEAILPSNSAPIPQPLPAPQAIPQSELPPLPALPNALPPVPGQAFYRPGQQILGADGRPVAARNNVMMPGSGSTRYGRAGHSINSAPSMNTVPASNGATGVPVRLVSQPAQKGRYGQLSAAPAQSTSVPQSAPVRRASRY